jgi:thiamine biosynthesis protein ThiI
VSVATAVPEETSLLLRFGELTLKSDPVRRRFTSLLKSNIEGAFARAGLDCLIRDDWGHLYVDTSDREKAAELLSRTFGLTSVSPVVALRTSKLDEIAAACAQYSLAQLPEGAKSFAVRPRRTGSHAYTSKDIGRECGSAIFQAARAKGHPLEVDLDTPDFEVEVEVREAMTYLYARRVACVGGLPLGTAGKVACVIRAGQPESLLDARAAWMIMKRGVMPVFAAAGDRDSKTPHPGAAPALAAALAWAPTAKVEYAPDPTDPAFLAALVRRRNCHAVNIGVIARGGQLSGPAELIEGYPTFHPLLAMTDEEIARIPVAAE